MLCYLRGDVIKVRVSFLVNAKAPKGGAGCSPEKRGCAREKGF